MLKLAFYGKGGIGKFTTCANLALAFTRLGKTVLQIGCDPKADSTSSLHPGISLPSVLDCLRASPRATQLSEVVFTSSHGIHCVEAGGPKPGLGCAGRGISLVLEYLEKEQAYTRLGIDCVLYDVLGDVVCGGFSTPMRQGNADYVLIVTSAEKMSLFAARKIAEAVHNFSGRNYAQLGGIIVNRCLLCPQDHDDERMHEYLAEEAELTELCQDVSSRILGRIHEDRLFREADRTGKPLLELFPQSTRAEEYMALARTLLTRFAPQEGQK